MTEKKKKPINSRAKGIANELEVCKILTEGLGVPVTRDWMTQTAIGGFDLKGLDSWAIEVKANESLSLKKMWDQTVAQAKKANRLPVLFRKIPLRGWEVYIPLSLVMEAGAKQFTENVVFSNPHCDVGMTACLTDAGFIHFVKTNKLI